mgnify:FL=1
MSYKKLRRLPLAAAALLACMSAQADYTSPDGKFRMSGFGTIGYSRASTDDVYFNYKGQGGGSQKSGSFDPDSKIAIQGTYKITDTVSGTAQVMTKYDAEGDYIPTFEWAFLKWQATPAVSFRAGKMGAPFFMISDFRDVGYANTTVRPPLDVYAQVPVSNFEGVDATHQFSKGSMTLTSSALFGEANADYSNALISNGSPVPPAKIKLKNLLAVNLMAEFDNGLAIRLGHVHGKLTISSSTPTALRTALAGVLAGGLGPVPQAQAQSLVDTVTQSNTDASFSGIGLTYDQNNIVVAAEYTKRRIDGGYVSDTTGWYTTAGYRFGQWLPYVGYGKVKVNDANATLPSVIPQLASAAAAVQATLNTQKVAQKTASVGVRWDAMPGLAVKAQYDRVSKPSDSYGMFLTANPLADIIGGSQFLNAKKSINVVTLSVDFVF